MLFSETKLNGAFLINAERREDHRGFFARVWCKDEFAAHGLNPSLAQANVGFSKRKGTLRGMHFQLQPFAECKLIRCTMGRVIDIIVDLRPTSVTYKQWFSTELSADNRSMLYVPEGVAHGYITLENDTELMYQSSQMYASKHATGVRYDDPAFQIVWPASVEVISDADRNWPMYQL